MTNNNQIANEQLRHKKARLEVQLANKVKRLDAKEGYSSYEIKWYGKNYIGFSVSNVISKIPAIKEIKKHLEKTEGRKPLMFENTANVGDKIRAYDFAPRFSRNRGEDYLEGVITDKGILDNKDYYSYKIKITKVVRDDKDVTEQRDYRFSYIPFETDMDNLEKEYYPKGKARVMKISEPSIKIEYFIWGVIDGEHKSFYVPVGGLEKFMDDQKLSVFTKNQIRNLQHCQGLELEKGFTIERRYTFGNGETSKKFKINLEA